MKLHTETFIGAKFDNDISTFFVDNPEQIFFLFQNLIGCINSYSSTHFIWTSSWLDLKTFFVKLLTDTFWGQKLTTTWVLFSWTNQIKKILLFHNLIVCIQPYFSPHSIWTSLWVDWKTLFVKLHTETFIGAKFDNDMSPFSRRQPRANIFSVSEPTRMHKLLL